MAAFDSSIEFDCIFAVELLINREQDVHGIDWDALCQRIGPFYANQSMWIHIFNYMIDQSRAVTVNPHYTRTKDIISVYIIFAVAILGLIANILIAVIFLKNKRKTVTMQLLLVLAAVDVVFLISKIILPAMIIAGRLEEIPTSRWTMCALVLMFTTEVMEVWMLMLITAERLVMACWPLRALSWVTVSRARWAAAGVILSAIIYRVPQYIYFAGKMPKTALYKYNIIYEVGFDGFVLLIIPLISLIVMNSKLLYTVIKAKQRRKQLTSYQSCRTANNSLEVSMTCNVITVVFLFLACQVLKFTFYLWTTDNSHWNRRLFDISAAEPMRFVVVPLAELMFVINSSVNFFIYIMLFPSFRRQCIETLLPCSKTLKNPTQTSGFSNIGAVRTTTKETTLISSGCTQQSAVNSIDSSRTTMNTIDEVTKDY